MTHVIFEPCIATKDTACVRVCPKDCIHPRPDEDGFAEAPQLYVDPAECIDCLLCVEECPVSAILPEEELPEDQKSFTAINAAYYGLQPPANVAGPTTLPRSA